MQKFILFLCFLLLSVIGFPQEITQRRSINEAGQPLSKREMRQYELKYGIIMFCKMDVVETSFLGFDEELDSFNIDLLNLSGETFSLELGGYYKRFYGGLSFGYGDQDNEDHDSLYLKSRTSRYSIHAGFQIINSRKFFLTPEVALYWNKYRLINYDNKRRIPLSQYMAERDLDIRINQMTVYTGLTLSYKVYLNSTSDFMTIGIQGGYHFNVNNKPWIYSMGNRLTSESKLSNKNFNFGVHFSFNWETLEIIQD